MCIADPGEEVPEEMQPTKRAKTKDRLTFRGEFPEADEVMDTVANKISWDCNPEDSCMSN